MCAVLYQPQALAHMYVHEMSVYQLNRYINFSTRSRMIHRIFYMVAALQLHLLSTVFLSSPDCYSVVFHPFSIRLMVKLFLRRQAQFCPQVRQLTPHSMHLSTVCHVPFLSQGTACHLGKCNNKHRPSHPVNNVHVPPLILMSVVCLCVSVTEMLLLHNNENTVTHVRTR